MDVFHITTYRLHTPLLHVVVDHPRMLARNRHDQDRTLLGIRHGPGHRIYLVCAASQYLARNKKVELRAYPYCRPSSNPGSRSVLMILSSNFVPPMYFKQSRAS
jgi:hypothetical protein